MGSKKNGGSKKGTSIRTAAIAKSGRRSGARSVRGSVKNRVQDMLPASNSATFSVQSFDEAVIKNSKIRCTECGRGLLRTTAFVEGPVRQDQDPSSQVRCVDHKSAGAYRYHLVIGQVVDVPQVSLKSLPLVSVPEVVEGPVEVQLAEAVLAIDDVNRIEVVAEVSDEVVVDIEIDLALRCWSTGALILSEDQAYTFGRTEMECRLGRPGVIKDFQDLCFCEQEMERFMSCAPEGFRLYKLSGVIAPLKKKEREALEKAFKLDAAFAFVEGSD